MAWVTGGMLLISCAAAYAWWCRVRVIDLRQDLFDIRDDMWDDARRLGCFSDPAYRSTREHLNGVATHASSFTFPILAVVMANRPEGGYPARPTSERHDVQKILDRALYRSSNRLTSYIVNESLIGWIVSTISAIALVGGYTKRLADDSSTSWMRSNYSDFDTATPPSQRVLARW